MREAATCNGTIRFNGRTSKEYGRNDGDANETPSDTDGSPPPLPSAGGSHSINPLLANRIGYVLQKEYLLPHLTVFETLLFAARFRLPAELSMAAKEARVDELIRELNLLGVRDSLIGDHRVRGLSGGEQRRVSTAVQMLHDPSCLLLDEPTTGLDAFTALSIVETCAALARQGRTVVMTLHQPRASIYKLLDEIVLMARGQIIFHGAPAQAEAFFAHHGYTIPSDVNPPDFFLDLLSIDVAGSVLLPGVAGDVDDEDDDSSVDDRHSASHAERTRIKQQRKRQAIKRVKQLQSAFEETRLDQREQLQPCLNSTSTNTTPTARHAPAGATTLTQIFILTQRDFADLARDRAYLFASLLGSVFVGLLIGLIFYDLPFTPAGIRSRTSGLYLTASLTYYLNMIFYIYKFSIDTPVGNHERVDRMYGATAYVASRVLIYLPFHLIFSLIYIAVLYPLIGLRSGASSFFIAVGTACLLQHACVAISFMCVAFQRSFAQASLIGNSFFTFFGLSTGFLVASNAIPPWVAWIQKISYLYYGWRLLATNEYSGREFTVCADPNTCTRVTGAEILHGSSLAVDDWTTPSYALMLIWAIPTITAAIALAYIPPPANMASEVATRAEEEESDTTNTDASHTPTEQHILDVDRSAASQPSSMQASFHTLVDHTESAGGVPPAIVDVGLRHRQQVTMTLRNISVSVTKRTPPSWRAPFGAESGPIPILQNVSATIGPGRLVAALGLSGCGKSTLLDLCAHRSSLFDSMKGDILFNGRTLSKSAWSGLVGYVSQSDHLLPFCTVRETLTFAARLRLAHASVDEIRTRVDDVIAELGLGPCADTIIGNEHVKGISGGESRRVSIGTQMITDPSVLILDGTQTETKTWQRV